MQSKPFTKTAVIKAAVFSLLIIIITCYEDEPLNFKEPGQRKDFDYMKWSKVKISAVHDICSLDSSQSELSYYLPFVRYHDRWKELGKLDFSYTPSQLYGFAPLYGSLHEKHLSWIWTIHSGAVLSATMAWKIWNWVKKHPSGRHIVNFSPT